MLVLAIAALVVVPPAISLALYRTRVWWLVGALMFGAALYLIVRGDGHPADDEWAVFPDFEGFTRAFAAVAIAIYAAVVLAITYLARAPREPR
jgi:hypothetical protein